eukprot:6209570-Pleurochrysis_carterae.AAC.2
MRAAQRTVTPPIPRHNSVARCRVLWRAGRGDVCDREDIDCDMSSLKAANDPECLVLKSLRALVALGAARGRMALQMPPAWAEDIHDTIRDAFLAGAQGMYTLPRPWIPFILEKLDNESRTPLLSVERNNPKERLGRSLKRLYNEACAELRPALALKLQDFRKLLAAIADRHLVHRATLAAARVPTLGPITCFKVERGALRRQIFPTFSSQTPEHISISEVLRALRDAGIDMSEDRIRALLSLLSPTALDSQSRVVPYLLAERLLLNMLTEEAFRQLLLCRASGANSCELTLKAGSRNAIQFSRTDQHEMSSHFGNIAALQQATASMEASELMKRWLGTDTA